MAYLSDRAEERTGVQEVRPFSPSIDLGCDFVMVYGTDDTMPERIAQYARAGYTVHLMTGIAWGGYPDYLGGEWDGESHAGESQTDREGRPVMHGPHVPYMVPVPAFADYLTHRLMKAVDCGVAAIHLEEPEFWDRSGYSAAFSAAWEERFHEPFIPQHASVDSHFRAASLKARLYAEALERISLAVRAYARETHGREVRFYVPTHSLLNYCQWKL